MCLLRDADELLLVVAESDEGLIGVFPLQLERRARFGVAVRRLQFPAHAHAVTCDFLVHPSLYGMQVFSQLIEYLHKSADVRWDIMQLARSPLGSCSDRLATEDEIYLGRSVVSGSISEIECGAQGRDPLSHLSGRFCRNLARLERRAARQGELALQSYTIDTDIEEGLRLFVDIENDGWKGEAGSSIASAANLQEFYRSLALGFAGKSRCCINILRIGGEPVAANFGIISNGTYFILKIGFRQRYATLGPGNLLLVATLRHFSEDLHVHIVNLVTSPEWAEKWKTNAKPVRTHTVFRNSLKGRLLYVMMHTKDWLKSIRQGYKSA